MLKPVMGAGYTQPASQSSFYARFLTSPKGSEYIIYRSFNQEITFKLKQIVGDSVLMQAIDSSDAVQNIALLFTKGTTSLSDLRKILTDYDSLSGANNTILNMELAIKSSSGEYTGYFVSHSTTLSDDQKFIANPYAYLVDLPASFKASYPISLADRIPYTGPGTSPYTGNLKIFENGGNSELYLDIIYNPACSTTTLFISSYDNVGTIEKGPLNGLFNPQIFPFISRYTGNVDNPNGTTVTSGDLWNKLFTLNTGNHKILHFGFFNHPTLGTVVYDYDPVNNTVGSFKGVFQATSSTANGNSWYRLTDLTTTSPTTRVFEIHIR